MTSTPRDAVLFLLLISFASLCAGQFLWVEWDAVPRSGGATRVPRIEGLMPAPAEKKEATASGRNEAVESEPEEVVTALSGGAAEGAKGKGKEGGMQMEEDQIERMLTAAFEEYGGVAGVASAVTVVKPPSEQAVQPKEVSHLPLDSLKAGALKQLTEALNITCKACLERHDHVAAIKSHLEGLSVGSLKNFLSTRGHKCTGCRTRHHLTLAARQIAHLPPASRDLFLCEMENVWLYPGTRRTFLIKDLKYKTLLATVLQGDARFGLSPMPGLGIVVRVEEMAVQHDGHYNIKVVGESRFEINHVDRSGTAAGGHNVATVTLITDEPLNKTQGNALMEMNKRTRTLFFAQDSDTAAERRAELLGNPPPPEKGAELFSYWLSAALQVSHQLASTLFSTRQTAARLEVLEPVLYSLIKQRSKQIGLDEAATVRDRKSVV